MSTVIATPAICPCCKLGELKIEHDVEYENTGTTADAQYCDECGWRSDDPPMHVARAKEGTCEGCRLPVWAGELVQRWGDDVLTHVACPKVARA